MPPLFSLVPRICGTYLVSSYKYVLMPAETNRNTNAHTHTYAKIVLLFCFYEIQVASNPGFRDLGKEKWQAPWFWQLAITVGSSPKVGDALVHHL